MRKLLDKILPKRFYKSEELAAIISDCFRFENGRSGPEPHVFNVGGEKLQDRNGNSRFFSVAEMQPCIDRINAVIKALEKGEPVTSPDQIPLAHPRGWATRGRSVLGTIRYCVQEGFEPEVVKYRLADNGFYMDMETVTFIMDALKAEKSAKALLKEIDNSQILPRQNGGADGQE